MTDLLFSNTIPTSKELSLIKQVDYSTKIKDNPDFFSIHVFNNGLMEATEPDILIPNWYYQHLLRFLWRHRLFIAIEGNTRIKLSRGHRTMVRRYIAYMDAIIEGLMMGCRIAKGNDATYRSRTFDMYLVVEFYIGRHEYGVGDIWRRTNKNPVLEATDVKDLDWEKFYGDQDNADSLWTGSEYEFDINKIPEDKLLQLKDLVATFFATTNPPANSEL